MMKLHENEIGYEIREISDNTLEVKFSGTRTTFTVLLSAYLNDEKDVEFAGWKMLHPSFNESSLVIKAKDPKKALKTVIKKIVKECEDLEKQIKQL